MGGVIGGCGQCEANDLVGSWLVFTHEGKCGEKDSIGDNGCTWKAKGQRRSSAWSACRPSTSRRSRPHGLRTTRTRPSQTRSKQPGLQLPRAQMCGSYDCLHSPPAAIRRSRHPLTSLADVVREVQLSEADYSAAKVRACARLRSSKRGAPGFRCRKWWLAVALLWSCGWQ